MSILFSPYPVPIPQVNLKIPLPSKEKQFPQTVLCSFIVHHKDYALFVRFPTLDGPYLSPFKLCLLR